ncbi:dipeptidase [Ructibacterium gallinarum]|uniref:Dipeptidase n=1 Tax=Ructibacterium gallinarum TaxID=2779355 RepID=A0A9D5R7Z0_9FIRM|nr:dipeptidase [Ructibacterium gallinarum]MBE5038874.1 dipeptidase [Ructibacterium gallinarum]
MKPRIFDAHCDTVFELQEQKKELNRNDLHLDLQRMEEYEGYIQVFAAFVDQKSICGTCMNHCIALLERMHREIEKNSKQITLIQTAEDLEEVIEKQKIGAVLSIEGGEALEGNLAALWMYYRLGVRLITLTWNHANEIADGITQSRGGGLTDFGRQAVAAMERMGILIDVSHLSVKGFWDVAEMTQYPFVASHSCVKALCPHPRNLDDDQIDLLISRRGGIGINFFPEFLTQRPDCIIQDILRHMEYILCRGGDETVGLGSDFDGVEALPADMTGVQDMGQVVQAMLDYGFTQNQVKNIRFENFRRIFHETMRRSM